MLKQSGLPISEIRDASNGEEALEVVRSGVPNLIITDIRMPLMDGLDLCKYLYKKCPFIKFIIVSGYEDFEYARRAIQYGVSDYLCKPLEQKSFTLAVKNALSSLCTTDYIGVGTVRPLISKVEELLWSGDRLGLEGVVKQICKIVDNRTLKYCTDFCNDFLNEVLSRLSVRIGYRIRTDFLVDDANSPDDCMNALKDCFMELAEKLDDAKKNIDNNIMNEIIKYIEDNYDSKLALNDIAEYVGFNPSYFSQYFKSKIGKNFVQYRNEVRINKAMDFLKQSDKSITEIALDVGYSDITYFIRIFKEHTGKSPGGYRKEQGMGKA